MGGGNEWPCHLDVDGDLVHLPCCECCEEIVGHDEVHDEVHDEIHDEVHDEVHE